MQRGLCLSLQAPSSEPGGSLLALWQFSKVGKQHLCYYHTYKAQGTNCTTHTAVNVDNKPEFKGLAVKWSSK